MSTPTGRAPASGNRRRNRSGRCLRRGRRRRWFRRRRRGWWFRRGWRWWFRRRWWRRRFGRGRCLRRRRRLGCRRRRNLRWRRSAGGGRHCRCCRGGSAQGVRAQLVLRAVDHDLIDRIGDRLVEAITGGIAAPEVLADQLAETDRPGGRGGPGVVLIFEAVRVQVVQITLIARMRRGRQQEHRGSQRHHRQGSDHVWNCRCTQIAVAEWFILEGDC